MKLVLVCYSGSSASILRDRMLAWARANLLDVEIIVSSLAGLDEDKEDADIVLVGPQVRCALASGYRRGFRSWQWIPEIMVWQRETVSCRQRWMRSGSTRNIRFIWSRVKSRNPQ